MKMTEINPFIQQYTANIFPAIQKCSLCKTTRNPNSPHEYAYIGPKYGICLDSNKNFKILVIGMIPNMDLNSQEDLEKGNIPSEYETYATFNTKLADEFRTYDIYTKSFGISSMLGYLNQYIAPEFQLTDQNIAFTNIASCYNKGGTTEKKIIDTMMENCSELILAEVKLIQPDVVIGIYSPILEWFDWFASKDANHVISIQDQDQFHRDWVFSESKDSVKHRTVKLYHPTYAATNYSRNGNTFHERLDLIVKFIQQNFPAISLRKVL